MPEKENIPSEAEIKKLPLWARVAFAAHCAKRVQPLYELDWPDAPQKHVKAVHKAIQITAEAAARTTTTARATRKGMLEANAVIKTKAAYRAAMAAARATTAIATGASRAAAMAAGAAAMAATEATKATAKAARATSRATAEAEAAAIAAEATSRATAEAARAAVTAGEATNKVTAKAARFDFIPMSALIRDDFNWLIKLSTEGEWDDTTSVSQDVFGPLSLELRSTKCRDFIPEEKELLLKVYIPDEIDKDSFVDAFIELYRAMNAYHIARGGRGLIIDDFQTFVREDALAEVLQ